MDQKNLRYLKFVVVNSGLRLDNFVQNSHSLVVKMPDMHSENLGSTLGYTLANQTIHPSGVGKLAPVLLRGEVRVTMVKQQMRLASHSPLTLAYMGCATAFHFKGTTITELIPTLCRCYNISTLFLY